MDIRKLVRPNVRSLRAYHAEEIACKVKLDANESPYSAVSGQRSAVSIRKNLQNIHRYPDPQATTLRKLIAEELRVKPENILHGNGSDELIYYLITVFGGPVMYPVPTFSMYGIISQALNEKKIEIPLDDKFDLDLDSIFKNIQKYDPKLIFLSSPNNPTGNSFSPDRITAIIKRSKGLVIVDEAYQQFSSKKSFVPLLSKYRNLVILRTLSKIGLAGIRVGFLLAHPEIISEVNKARLPFNINSLSQVVAIAALKNKKQMYANIKAIISERKKLYKEMEKINSLKPYTSDANFILFRVDRADTVFKELIKKGVLLRNLNAVCKGCLRVTIGTPGENSFFLKTLRKVI